MAKKTEAEKLEEIEKKIQQLKAQKQLAEARLKEKNRKERTRRLIQMGAIFEKYFELEGTEDAEQVALSYHQAVQEHKEQIKRIDIEKSKEQGTLVYKEVPEKLVTPSDTSNDYNAVNK